MCSNLDLEMINIQIKLCIRPEKGAGIALRRHVGISLMNVFIT